MKKYECPCGYVYDPVVGDPDNGIAPGTSWEDVPEDWVGKQAGESGDQVRRFIRLTYLIKELQDFVDKGQMKMRPAVELSYLDEETQRDVVDRIDETEAFPSHDQAIRIRRAYENGEIDYDKVRDIMDEEKPNQKPKFTFSFDRLKPYIPKDYSDSKAEDYVTATQGTRTRRLIGISSRPSGTRSS